MAAHLFGGAPPGVPPGAHPFGDEPEDWGAAYVGVTTALSAAPSLAAAAGVYTEAPPGAWDGTSARRFVRGGARGPQLASYPGSDLLRPAEDMLPVDVAERDALPFDWADHLGDGEVLLSITRTLEVIDGADAQAADRLLGEPERYETKARQWVEGVQQGVTYLLRMVGTTSVNGRRITLAGRFKGVREI